MMMVVVVFELSISHVYSAGFHAQSVPRVADQNKMLFVLLECFTISLRTQANLLSTDTGLHWIDNKDCSSCSNTASQHLHYL